MLEIDTTGDVVVVDDDEVDRMLARRCFERSRLTNPWREFTDSEAFLEHMDDVKSGRAPMPAVVLVDVRMPGLSGFELIRRLKRDPYFASAPPFIVFTNAESDRDVATAREVGADRYLVKPPTMQAFIDLFDAMAGEVDTGG